MAVAGMVSGVVGAVTCFTVVPGVLGAVFGFVGAHQIKRNRDSLTGLGMARAGWITGVVGAALGVMFWVWLATSGELDEVDGRGTQVGTCIDLDDDLVGGGFAVPTVDCHERHGAEVFEIGWLNPTRDRTYPGATDVRDEALARCAGEPFAEYVGVRSDASTLVIDVLAPPADEWSDWRGEYTCVVVAREGTLRDSVHRSER
jgi:Domain of unknown function (DUF4190)/Septum formation